MKIKKFFIALFIGFVLNNQQAIPEEQKSYSILNLPLATQRKILSQHPIKGFILQKAPINFNQLRGHTGGINYVTFNSDGTKIATVSADNTARIWDSQTGEKLLRLSGHADSILIAAFSPDGTQLATGSKDKTTILWDVQTGEKLHQLKGHNDWINDLIFSPDGTQLATGSKDKTTILWDVQTGEKLNQLQGHTDWINNLAFSPDGTRLVTGSKDKTIIIWNIHAKNIENFFSQSTEPPMNKEQIQLLLEFWEVIESREQIQATNEQWEIFQSLPQEVQNALQLYIKAPSKK